MDTIVSISTPLGSGAVGIVRMSGDNACGLAEKIFKPYQLDSFNLAQPNMMYLGALNCGGVNDIALAVKFAAPRSYTGEDVVEFHCHGGISLVKKVYNGCVEMGARAADRGEFTRRAFL
ncbi:MAG: tRNA uridine-5-carboxymethylaminomethyl(34) synthesis GTPase MnmE, partial [Clostridia bacterium]|nr:tRNA uridine-5-carboxymethylaminomethyl(34) synthesis GTPase MnmE [Clostridia bacterium]